MTNLSKRKFLIGASLVGIGGAVFGQAPAPQAQQMKPYLEIKPISSDGNIVRAWFSPSCTYSKAYFTFFQNLGRTLPGGFEFEWTPVVNRGDGVSYSLAYAAVKRFHPQYLSNFVQASLQGVQELQINTKSWQGINRVAKAARISEDVPALIAKNKKEILGDVNALLELRAKMGVTNTPSVSVAGTYIVTPEFVKDGDPALFNQLVNGVISLASGGRSA